MLTLAVLGPLEVRRDGVLLSLPSGRTTEVLVRLALDAGRQVRTDRIIGDLWADGATGRNTLQSKVSQLRRALAEPDLVTGGNGGYTLNLDAHRVDALRVVGLAASATASRRTGDAAAALDVATEGLSLFRGDVLVDAGDGEWLQPHRARLDEIRLGLLEVQLAARVDLAPGGEVIGELEGLVSRHPLREGLWSSLITALYRMGRQADALAAYRRVRELLVDELGVDPGPSLRALEDQILQQSPTLDPPAGRPAVLVGPIGNLPSLSGELLGREPEVAAVTDLLASQRLVEIVGPGGIGKTALAIAVGRQLAPSTDVGAGGVWLARLETAVTANDVVDVLVAALNGPGGEAALFERLKGAAALVILDNCEHVRDAAAGLAVRLLDSAPGLRILCTSQVRLDVDGETVFELAPLELRDAVELFTRRARAQRLGRPSTANDEAVLGLCRSLDGLPLAIELAAARTKTLSVGEITRRLDDRFSVLSDPTSRRPERRRSLRSTIGWSYELLFPDDKRGLWALATFASGASLPAVESVLEALDVPAAAAIDVVGRLASRSLVIVDDEAASLTGGSARYRLLDSIRAFALEAMAEAMLSERALAAHAAWFAEAARSSTQGVRSARQAEHLSFAQVERANIDAALAWTATRDPLLGLGIVNGFGWAWVVQGDSRGTERILTALDAAGDAGQVEDRASALLLAAWIEASTGRLELARDHIAAAAELADEARDADLQARCSYYLAYVVSHDGSFRQAMELTDRSRAVYDGLDRPWDQVANWLFAARAAISAGDQERSVEAVDQVDHWLRVVEDPWLQVRGDAIRGELARIHHRFDDAVRHLGRAAEASRRLGFKQTEAYQVASLGRAQCQAGDYDAGRDTLELAVDKAQATGDVRLAALARVHLGRVLRAVGQVGGARTALESASAWHRDAGGGEQARLGECLVAALDVADRVAGAEGRLVAILEEARTHDDAPVEVFALDALARVAAMAGETTNARDLCQAADRRMTAASHFITDLDRTDARWVRQLA